MSSKSARLGTASLLKYAGWFAVFYFFGVAALIIANVYLGVAVNVNLSLPLAAAAALGVSILFVKREGRGFFPKEHIRLTLSCFAAVWLLPLVALLAIIATSGKASVDKFFEALLNLPFANVAIMLGFNLAYQLAAIALALGFSVRLMAPKFTPKKEVP